MLYDFTEKALSVPTLSASNKVLQAIKSLEISYFPIGAVAGFLLMPPDRNLPGELLQGALWCHLSVQVLGVSCRAWGWHQD